MVAKRPSPTLEVALIESAREYARSVTGYAITKITLVLADGSKRKIEVPACCVENWPPSPGWAVRGTEGAFNGATFKLTGKSLQVFRALVEAGDEGLSSSDLRRTVWDQQTDHRTVENAVSRLRAILRESLELAELVDPIEANNDRYRLAGS